MSRLAAGPYLRVLRAPGAPRLVLSYRQHGHRPLRPEQPRRSVRVAGDPVRERLGLGAVVAGQLVESEGARAAIFGGCVAMLIATAFTTARARTLR